jgi:hypothetical protein
LKYLPVAEAIGLTFIAPLIALYLAAVIIIGRLIGNYDEDTGRGIVAILMTAKTTIEKMEERALPTSCFPD